MKKLLIGLMLLGTVGCTRPSEFIPTATVKITNMAENSGGSGTVVNSTETLSMILTNRHVCKVVEHGGLVHLLDGRKLSVTAFKMSNRHDLCAIFVSAHAGPSASVSRTAPLRFDHATTSGHPHLLPVIITRGHFSDKLHVKIIMGLRDCTEAEKSNPNTGFICALIGKLPVVGEFESIVVSTTIQPGSSGSGIYGEENQISAVVFAGSGELGYALAVPHEYVYNFLFKELDNLNPIAPKAEDGVAAAPSSTAEDKEQILKKIEDVCKTHQDNSLCKAFNNSLNYDDLIEEL
jgi:hypothetical protein